MKPILNALFYCQAVIVFLSLSAFFIKANFDVFGWDESFRTGFITLFAFLGLIPSIIYLAMVYEDKEEK